MDLSGWNPCYLLLDQTMVPPLINVVVCAGRRRRNFWTAPPPGPSFRWGQADGCHTVVKYLSAAPRLEGGKRPNENSRPAGRARSRRGGAYPLGRQRWGTNESMSMALVTGSLVNTSRR